MPQTRINSSEPLWRTTTAVLAQRSDFATIHRLTGFQEFRRCETVLQEGFDWRYLCARPSGAAACAGGIIREASSKMEERKDETKNMGVIYISRGCSRGDGAVNNGHWRQSARLCLRTGMSPITVPNVRQCTKRRYRSSLRCHRDQAGAVGNPVGRLLRSALKRTRSESLKSKRMRKSSRLGTSLCHDPSLTLAAMSPK